MSSRWMFLNVILMHLAEDRRWGRWEEDREPRQTMVGGL